MRTEVWRSRCQCFAHGHHRQVGGGRFLKGYRLHMYFLQVLVLVQCDTLLALAMEMLFTGSEKCLDFGERSTSP